jgi:hypothetical protein
MLPDPQIRVGDQPPAAQDRAAALEYRDRLGIHPPGSAARLATRFAMP